MKKLVALACLSLFAALAAGRAETVSALGRVLPASGVLDVFAPGGDVVEAVLVREGEWVEAGTPLARLRGLAVAQARLAQIEAENAAQLAAATADAALARQRIAQAENEVKIAEARLKRITDTRESALISADKIEDRQLARAEALMRLATARDALARATQAAATAHRAAVARVAEARAQIAEREARAPIRCRILKVLTAPGASTNHGTLFKVGDTSSMHVVAEIYEADALKIKAGQAATIASPALPKKLAGRVARAGTMILRNHLQSLDPNAATNARVVEATLEMNDRETLERLVFLQVDVTISL